MTVVVMMGVSGVGKTTVGRRLAEALGCGYAEGDSYHPAANVEKMRTGTPLEDADRWPWLHAMAADIDRWRAEGKGMVLACSALKRAYRDILIGDRQDVRLVQLTGEEALIRSRIAARKHEYMPASLLISQLATLEPPAADERPIVVDVRGAPETCVAQILGALEEVRPS
ncbi:MAG: gluconokinase [Thalassobaculum sp.]|uniref:gluconokinase n=1 Tax=Thalassobaculum sp. TaxID=2022740 RepID=UPI0032EB9772